MKSKLETLCRLNGIECRFGGGALLAYHHLAKSDQHIDLFVAPDQFEVMDRVLSRAGEKIKSEDGEALSTYIGQYMFQNGKVKVVANFRRTCSDGIYTHPYIEPNGSWMHLEEWIILYTVMNNVKKLNSLHDYFEEHSLNHSILFSCLKRAPHTVIEGVTTAFQDVMKR